MHVLSTARRADVVRHLMEGCGVRPASRLTETHKTTISSFTLKMGQGCTWLHNAKVWGLSLGRFELDEMHGFIHTRKQNLRGDEPKEWGETWLWLAIASTAKLIVSYRVGPTRGEREANELVKDLRGRITTIPELNTDGLESYVDPIRRWFGGVGGGVQYSQCVKAFKGKRGAKDYDRYAPPKEPYVTKKAIFGTPDLDTTSTSFVERSNLSVRTNLRRFVRRGTGHSKSLAHHEATIAIFVMWFNFCRVHETLRVTPAMQAGLTGHVWTVEELVEAAMSAKPCKPPEPLPLAPAPEAPSAMKATERTTSTGFTLKALDGGKAPKKPKRGKARREGPQTTIWTVLREAQRREEERAKGPPDEPKGAG